MRRILLFMLPMLLSIAPPPATAVENEIGLGVTTATRYNDNVFNVSEGKTDSFTYEVGPVVRLSSSASNFEAGATYVPRFVTYIDGARDDDLNHVARVSATYEPSERMTLGLSDVFMLQSDADRDLIGGGFDLDGGGDKQTLENNLTAEFKYLLNPRFSFASSGGYVYLSREDKDLSGSVQASGQVQGGYALSPRDTVGAGASARHHLAEGIPEIGVADSTTDYYGVFLYWNHQFTQLVTFKTSGGPTWLWSNLDDDGEGASRSLDYFASAGLSAEFDKGTASIDYQRSSADYARNSAAYLTDNVGVQADWGLSRRLALAVSAEWNQREVVTKNAGWAGAVGKVVHWRAVATASYRLTRELVGSLTVDYLRQDESDRRASDRFRVLISFNYNARAFRF